MPGLSQTEFDALLASEKVIADDISWQPDQDHSPTVEFTAKVESPDGYPLVMRGSYNREAKTLSYVLLHRGVGRIYALDLGKEHRNPSTQKLIGELHKHKWTEQHGDREAYRPTDITATADDPVTVWKQFCTEAGIRHDGAMATPVRSQGLFDA